MRRCLRYSIVSNVFLCEVVIKETLFMRYFYGIVLIIFFSALIQGCKKEIDDSECDNLKLGLLLNDTKLVIKNLESKLTSYSEENLDKLAKLITDQFNIPASVVCVDCIETNPEQSEIIFSLVQPGSTIQKRMDMSHTADNKMKIVNVHD